ncbi:MAG: acyl-CoA dehydrogenase family protein, partial [Deltaproteobacteria bacterium]|nr:acyl-CoA dehydrogenase family protein [Deltaproteobacteria bacterium]
MDLELTQDQRMIRELAMRFAETEIKPRAAALDATAEHPEEILRGLADLKMLGLTVPVEYGGGGMDQVGYVLALMEISKACASTGTIMMVNNSLYCAYLTAFGSDEQKMRYLYPCATGDRLGCHGLAEAEAGSDLSGMQTTALRDGDEWVISGEKRFVTNGGVSSYCVLTATTDTKKGEEGISSFVLDLEKISG